MKMKVASICVVQTVAQYTPYAEYAPYGYGLGSAYDMPYTGMPSGIPSVLPSQVVHAAEAHPYVGAHVYPQYDISMPQVMPQVMPQYDFAMPQVMPQVYATRPDAPHPDAIQAEQASHLKTAQENLEKEKQAQWARFEEDQKRITEDLEAAKQKALSQAQAQTEERIKNLDLSFQNYEKRLAEQTRQLTGKYCEQRARESFEEAERTIAAKFQAAAANADPYANMGLAQEAASARQLNMQQYVRDLEAISRGEFPAELLQPAAGELPVAEDPPTATEDPPADDVPEPDSN